MAYKGRFRLPQKERCVTHKKRLCSRLERLEISLVLMAYKGRFRLPQKERCVTHKKRLCSRLERLEISLVLMAYKGRFRLPQKERCVTHKKRLCSRLERLEISLVLKIITIQYTKGKGRLSYRSLKAAKRLTDAFYGCETVESTFWFCALLMYYRQCIYSS